MDDQDFEYKPRPDWNLATPDHVEYRAPPPRAWWWERLLAKFFPPRIGSKRWNRLHGNAGYEVPCEADEWFKEALKEADGAHQGEE